MFGCFVHIHRIECKIVVLAISLDYDTSIYGEQNKSSMIGCYVAISLRVGKPNSTHSVFGWVLWCIRKKY